MTKIAINDDILNILKTTNSLSISTRILKSQFFKFGFRQCLQRSWPAESEPG